MVKKKRQQRTTLLIVGEGDTEVAFLKYLKSVYCQKGQGPKVEVRNAHGGGPGNVLRTAIKGRKSGASDHVVAVLDKDIPWPSEMICEAQNVKVELIGNDPCIEATFLTMLNLAVPNKSSACKAGMTQYDLLDRAAYAKWCNRSMIESAAKRLSDLDRLVTFYKLK